VGPRAGLDTESKEKIPAPAGIRTPIIRSQSLYRLSIRVFNYVENRWDNNRFLTQCQAFPEIILLLKSPVNEGSN